MMMSAGDYIIVAPNRRGLPGFGKEWNEEISGDYGGQCMKDYFTAIDEFCTEPYVDKDHPERYNNISNFTPFKKLATNILDTLTKRT